MARGQLLVRGRNVQSWAETAGRGENSMRSLWCKTLISRSCYVVRQRNNKRGGKKTKLFFPAVLWTSCHDDRDVLPDEVLLPPCCPIRWWSWDCSMSRRGRTSSSSTMPRRTAWSRNTSGRSRVWRSRRGPPWPSTNVAPRNGGSATDR